VQGQDKENKINGEYTQQDVSDFSEVDSDALYTDNTEAIDLNHIPKTQALHETSNPLSSDSYILVSVNFELEESQPNTDKPVETTHQNEKLSQAFAPDNEPLSKQTSNNENFEQKDEFSSQSTENRENTEKNNEDTAKSPSLNRGNMKKDTITETNNPQNQFLKASKPSSDECSEDCKKICQKKNEQGNCINNCISNFCAIDQTSNSDFYTVILTGAVLFLVVGIIYLFMQNKSMRVAIEHGEFGVATYSHISS